MTNTAPVLSPNEAASLMFDEINAYCSDLENEVHDFWNNKVIKLPANGEMGLVAFGGLSFHCFYHKGKKIVIPDNLVKELSKTKLKALIRKRYALHVLYTLKSARGTARSDFRVGVIEVLPSIAYASKKGLKKKSKKSIRLPRPQQFSNIALCSHLDLSSYQVLTDPEEILNQKVRWVTRTPGHNGSGRYKVEEGYASLSRLDCKDPKVDLSSPETYKEVPDLAYYYHNLIWGEKVREAFQSLKDNGFFLPQ